MFGKEQIQVIETNNNNNVVQMNMSDLLALANSSNVNDESGSYDASGVGGASGGE